MKTIEVNRDVSEALHLKFVNLQGSVFCILEALKDKDISTLNYLALVLTQADHSFSCCSDGFDELNKATGKVDREKLLSCLHNICSSADALGDWTERTPLSVFNENKFSRKVTNAAFSALNQLFELRKSLNLIFGKTGNADFLEVA